ncbi:MULTISPECIES: hypothetical protein [unclassified Rhodococcus (in: high G+C Gram-positive bacteria)]|uniref:hypothetical protein n=1 Tax=unclassified Rhodococcus (in: high G+C Gram-positive bacteria) TaxID=192944 RepID=UPI001144A6C3|nr:MULTISPECIES: hypothetical protein [unclassified Rhodococcus (in: high G+C Gram-positive bacteria)]TQC38603.1 hypothetical protein EEB16_10345 [Rhodococcus sp. WS7]
MVPMLRQNVIVHEISLSTGTPWHIYGAAVLAGLIAIGGWYVVHRTSQSRDLLNWRRTTLLKVTSDLLEASSKRNRTIGLNLRTWTPQLNQEQLSLLEEMKQCRNQLWIAGADELYKQAMTIIEMHVLAAENARFHLKEPYLLKAIVNQKELERRHNQLLIMTRTYINSKEIKKAIGSPTGEQRREIESRTQTDEIGKSETEVVNS